MGIIKVNKKWIALAVIFSFICLIHVESAPARTEASRSGTVSAAAADDGNPSVMEKESASGPTVKKKNILPWILAGAGIVVAGLLVYLLILKKPKYTLTVTSGEGVNGTPAAGTYTYQKGKTVNYSFSLLPGYKNLVVQLDGEPVGASGVIVMKGNHILNVSAAHLLEYTLNVSRGAGVNGMPETGSYTVLEGSKIDYAYSLVTGFQGLKVILDGTEVPSSGSVFMTTNHVLNASASENEIYYQLEVKLSPAEITGYPLPKIYTFLKGTEVNYHYEFSSGNFYVYLDSKLECASPFPPNASCTGSVVMNANHLLDIVGD